MKSTSPVEISIQEVSAARNPSLLSRDHARGHEQEEEAGYGEARRPANGGHSVPRHPRQTCLGHCHS